jgi:uncharacterized membrane protein (DUF373 family)
MEKILNVFERYIVIILILLIMVVIVIDIIILCVALFKVFSSPSSFLASEVGFLDVLGDVLLVLIGIELLDTVKAYLSEHVIHVEVVLEVALIAVARKVIILDYKEYPPLTILAIASLILVLSIGYFLEKRGRLMRNQLENHKVPASEDQS